MAIMTNQEKINFLQDYIEGIQYSINILEQDIIDSPYADIEGKRPRQLVLQDLISQKDSLLNEIQNLQK